MDELGHILREAREARGLSLGEVQAQTRINSRFLEALENGNYAILPTPVHVRGFLRNYARFLDLDPAPLLERYEIYERQHPSPVVETPVPLSTQGKPLNLRDDQPFFDPVNVELSKGSGGERDPQSLMRLLIILALIVSLGLIAARFVPLLMGRGDGATSLTESVNQAWQDFVTGVGDNVEATPVDTDVTDPVTATDEAIQNTSRNDFSTAADTAFPTPFPTRPPLPATLEVINLRLDISERTWMEVTVDGDVRFNGWATRGDVFEWTAEDEVYLVTGNAYGIIATINEIELGRLGGFQEAREETWQTTQ
ncbi:MAG: helix-turn-helix domain-containing protein [Anaerolineales bacterium]|nr:helix-turn-helix domain-containing protein [Anaerolineales bacterium]